MNKKFDIHGIGLKVESERERFIEFLEKRYQYFNKKPSGIDLEVNVRFKESDFSEEEFSMLGAETKINGNQLIYKEGPLKLRATSEETLVVEAFLDPETWKHYGRIAKKGKKRTWDEYYEYYIIRRAIQWPLMWKMQQKGFYPVHASAVEKDGKAYVFTGFGGVGKTTLGLYLAENGYRLLGDNFVFLKDGNVYPYPEMLRVTDFTLDRISGIERTGREVFGQEIVDIGDEKISMKSSGLEELFILTRGDFSHSRKENSVDKLLGIADNLQEFHTHHYPSLFSFVSDENVASREKIYGESLKNTSVETLSYSNFEDVKKLIEGDLT